MHMCFPVPGLVSPLSDSSVPPAWGMEPPWAMSSLLSEDDPSLRPFQADCRLFEVDKANCHMEPSSQPTTICFLKT